MFSGLTLANVLGVPAGTALGQAFGWRAAFWAIVPIGLLAAAALFWFVPHQPKGGTGLVHEFRVLRRPQVLLGMSMSTLTSASLFCVFTYVAPTLETVTHISPHGVTITLLLFGVGITIGNLLGGRLSDWRPTAFLVGSLIVLIASLALLYFVEPYALPSVAMILIWEPCSSPPEPRCSPASSIMPQTPPTSPPPSIREPSTSATPPEPPSAACSSPPDSAIAASPSPPPASPWSPS